MISLHTHESEEFEVNLLPDCRMTISKEGCNVDIFTDVTNGGFSLALDNFMTEPELESVSNAEMAVAWACNGIIDELQQRKELHNAHEALCSQLKTLYENIPRRHRPNEL